MRQRKRIRHYNEPGDAHDLTFSCYQQRPYLSRDRTRQWLVEAIDRARKSLDYRIWAYAIMPEHVHLICWPEDEIYDISLFIESIKQSVSRKAKNFLELNDPNSLKKMTVKRGKRETFRFWQTGHGYDRNIMVDDTLLKKMEYIHNNPVRKRLVEKQTDWKWSSAEWYSGERNVPLSIDPIP